MSVKKNAVRLFAVMSLALAASAASAAPEQRVVRWNYGTSGNVLVTIAENKGYFKDEGLTIEPVLANANADAMTLLATGKVDVVSNSGTAAPLQQIAAGIDLTIFGGHMVTGCMPVIARAGAEWNGVQSLIASLLCIVLGMLIGYIVLLFINPTGAGEAIVTVMKNFLNYNRADTQLKYLGNTLVKTAPLLMCSLSILFAYKVGLFNIGAAGQYCFGVALSLYAALGLGWSWLPCLLVAMAGGAVLGAISGVLKSYCNVNEVISGIMLNWIVLYLTNMLLTTVKEAASPYTIVLANNNPSAVLPSLGLGALFNKNQYVGLAIPLSIVMAILIWIVLDKTRFGYELKATGFNRNAAKYCGMAEKRNVILSLVISGALAGMGAALLYLTGYEQWQCSTSSVPAMGFNGIAAAFLGGLNPLGTMLASFFIQHITAGGAYVDKSMYCAQISDLISSIIIYLCGFVLFMKHVMNSSIAKREEKAALKAKAAAEQDAANGKGGDQA